MSDHLHQEHLDHLTGLTSLDATFAAEEQRLLAARQTSLRAANDELTATRSQIATLRDESRRVDSRLSELARRHGVTPTSGGVPVPPTIEHHTSALRELTEELRRLEEADAWLRRTAEQIAAAGPAPALHPMPAPPASAPAPAPAPAQTGGASRWPLVVVPAAVVAIIVIVLVVLQKG